MSSLKKHSFSLSGHRTSIALEQEFWSVLTHMAHHKSCSLAALIAHIDAHRLPEKSLASLLRLHALRHAAAHGTIVFQEAYSAPPAIVVENKKNTEA